MMTHHTHLFEQIIDQLFQFDHVPKQHEKNDRSLGEESTSAMNNEVAVSLALAVNAKNKFG